MRLFLTVHVHDLARHVHTTTHQCYTNITSISSQVTFQVTGFQQIISKANRGSVHLWNDLSKAKYLTEASPLWQARNPHKTWFSQTQLDEMLASVHLTSSLDKIATILQTAFSDSFSWMKSFVFGFKFHRNLFLRVQLTSQHCFR